ncbi:MAG: hypothetical protein IJ532_07770 [Alphaproteobacteria bacterium]|nr:hypothetical protein [Alphaproteobacteria bacterium]
MLKVTTALKHRIFFIGSLIVFLISHLTLLAPPPTAKHHAACILIRVLTPCKPHGGGERVFCNPPFSQKAAFIAKAYDEVINGDCAIVVMVLPSNCTDCRAFHQYIYKKFFYEILSGRVSFVDPATGRAAKGNNSGTVIIYFKKDITARE